MRWHVKARETLRYSDYKLACSSTTKAFQVMCSALAPTFQSLLVVVGERGEGVLAYTLHSAFKIKTSDPTLTKQTT